MITFTSEITERQMMKGFSAHSRTALNDRWLRFLICGCVLAFTLWQMFGRPHDSILCYLITLIIAVAVVASVAIAMLGIDFIFNRLFLRFFLARRIRQMPAYGQTVTWELDETGIKGRCEGFSMEQTWALCFSATFVKDGILLYAQKNMFYWWPIEGFQTMDDFKAAAELVLANVKKVKIKDGTAGAAKK